jgi:hypothetical protein
MEYFNTNYEKVTNNSIKEPTMFSNCYFFSKYYNYFFSWEVEFKTVINYINDYGHNGF